MSLELPSKTHFIGIGGAGMSAIAKVLLERGFDVSGSDLKTSRATTMLQAMGAEIVEGHDPANVEGADRVVVSAAISPHNPEYRRAKDMGLPILTRGEALASILYDTRSIVVAGTHGKTTTTSMVVTVLRKAGLDPTYLVGAGLNDVGTNARSGSSDVVVAESDESDGSFLLLAPFVAVITNIELDHVDHWPNLDDLYAAFARFIDQTSPGGAVVVPVDDDRILAGASHRRTITFGDGGDVSASNVTMDAIGMDFDLVTGSTSARVHMKVSGRHNLSNALAAAGAALALGIPVDEIASGLQLYRGVERRFQLRGSVGGITIIDDYAHHPTEVKATLAAARPGPWKRVVALFQPHRYSRTAALATAFGRAFSDADRIVLMDVYGAGEEPVPGISGKVLADYVAENLPGRPVAYFPHRAEVIGYLVASARPGDVVLTLGAGDVTTVGEELLARLGDER
ncbi:MAG: UDP-N-acetylmuramate--L-alanine ligase [Actinomycetota bacterium]